MRIGSSFHTSTGFATTTTTSDTAVATVPAAQAESGGVARSPWHSPVPYLFGGLAAMMGLIAFALLILACSYWKLSNNGEIDQNEGDRDHDDDDIEEEMKGGGEKVKMSPVFEEKVLVIMAGDDKPTFIATPRISKAAQQFELGDTSSIINGNLQHRSNPQDTSRNDYSCHGQNSDDMISSNNNDNNAAELKLDLHHHFTNGSQRDDTQSSASGGTSHHPTVLPTVQDQQERGSPSEDTSQPPSH